MHSSIQPTNIHFFRKKAKYAQWRYEDVDWSTRYLYIIQFNNSWESCRFGQDEILLHITPTTSIFLTMHLYVIKNICSRESILINAFTYMHKNATFVGLIDNFKILKPLTTKQNGFQTVYCYKKFKQITCISYHPNCTWNVHLHKDYLFSLNKTRIMSKDYQSARISLWGAKQITAVFFYRLL